jgi:hypothetical protein
MYPAIGTCPVCQHELFVTRLQCQNCTTSIEGHFTLSRFAQLDDEQLAFLELFIRMEGKLNRVQQELGIPYTQARARLSEVVETMGYDAPNEDPPLTHEQRQEILELVKIGEISAEEAMTLLKR